MSSAPGAPPALLIAHAAAVLLGGASLFPRLLSLPAEQLVPLRTAVAALLLLVLAWRRGQSWSWLRGRTLGELLLLSALLGGHWWCYFAAIQAGGVGPAVVLVYSAPVLTVLLEALLTRQAPAGRLLLAGSGVMLGVTLLVWPARDGGAITPATLGLGLAAALLYALRNLLLSQRFRQPPGEALAGAQFALVALLSAPALVTGVQLDGQQIGGLLLFGSLFTALPHLGVVLALQRLPASTVGLITSLEVPYALLFAALLLGESLSPPLLAGGACIVAAALLASRARRG
ncbi:MAG: DMT family transporter [Stagnimonas sp.]|nr:DMT family transporter [Stagnimonas sp.]